MGERAILTEVHDIVLSIEFWNNDLSSSVAPTPLLHPNETFWFDKVVRKLLGLPGPINSTCG
jgi:hypothetical protein